MGNYRFRFSDILPNAWFYKLKDTTKSRNKKITRPTTKKQQHTSSSSSSSSSNVAAPALSSKTAAQQTGPHLSHQRKSYYFTRDLSTPPPPANDHDQAFSDDHHVATDTRRSSPPRKSSKKKRITTRRAILSSSNNSHSSNNRSTPSPRLVSSSVTAGCSCRSTIESGWTTNPDSTTCEDCPNSPLDSSSCENESLLLETTVQGMVSWSASSSCRCRSVENDIIIDVENRPLNSKLDDIKNDELEPPPPPPPPRISKPEGPLFNSTLSQRLHLPPIITKPTKEREGNEPSCCRLRRRSSSAEFEERNGYGSLSVKVVKEDILGTIPAPARISSISSSSPGAVGLKLRTNSPRIANKRIQARKSLSWSSSSSSSKSRNRSRSRRRSVSESFAVVKSSKDPQKDFRESMVEMIVENNISASKDLEDLLACYLSLNSDQYHDLIIRVFQQIWFDIVDLHPN